MNEFAAIFDVLHKNYCFPNVEEVVRNFQSTPFAMVFVDFVVELAETNLAQKSQDDKNLKVGPMLGAADKDIPTNYN